MKTLFWVFLALLLATFYHRGNHYDEAWLAEQAYWLLQDGVVRSELFRGLNGWENQLFVFHKLFIYLSAGWQALFGFSLVAGKSFSLVGTTLGGLLLRGYLRQQGIGRRFVWLGLLLYVSSRFVIEFSFVYRPEATCAALGFASFWLLTNSRWAWAALLAGLAALTHLNGLCFVLAGGGFLLWTRQPWQATGFGILAGLTTSFYLLDVLTSANWATFLMQVQNDPARWQLQSMADKIWLTGQTAWFTGLNYELSLLVGTAYLLNRHDRPASQPISRYLLLVTGGYLGLSRGYAAQYVLLLVPFVCAFTALQIAGWQPAARPVWAVWGWKLALSIYLLTGFAKAAASIRFNLTTPGVAQLNADMASLIRAPGQKVLAPLHFFYGQMGHYQVRGIDRHVTNFFKFNPQSQLTNQQLFTMAEREGFAAVITYDGKGPAAPLTDTRPLTDSLNQLGTYRRVYQDRWNSLYLASGQTCVEENVRLSSTLGR